MGWLSGLATVIGLIGLVGQLMADPLVTLFWIVIAMVAFADLLTPTEKE